MAKVNPILSQDGSHTLISPLFGVSYHSKYGAIEESQTIFIEAGLQHIINGGNQNLSIFEMGFGTGLNAFMTFLEANERSISVKYTGIEAYPISPETARELNYPELLKATSQIESLIKMHSCIEDEVHHLSPNFQFLKIISKIEDFQTAEKFDLIYFDAFAPSAQPNLWEAEIIEKMYNILNENGVLVTYCAKGVFKRLLKSIGFKCEGLPGPTGKREITRATK